MRAFELVDRIETVQPSHLETSRVVELAWEEIVRRCRDWKSIDYFVEYLCFRRQWDIHGKTEAKWVCGFHHKNPDLATKGQRCATVIIDDSTGGILECAI